MRFVPQLDPGCIEFALRRCNRPKHSCNTAAFKSFYTAIASPKEASVEGLYFARFVRAFFWCAEHAQQLGGESPLSSLMVAKD
jgi:hypothetical protein